jgi:hypothetical protein
MNEESIAVIARLGEALDTAVPDDADWTWEERFRAALVVLSVEDTRTLYGALSKVCDQDWTVDNVDQCPSDVRILVNEMGGLRTGQHMFSASMEASSFAYFSSWPWNDEAHVSVRFGVFYPEGDKAKYSTSRFMIKRGLGIQP